jgi:hypothetical protein
MFQGPPRAHREYPWQAANTVMQPAMKAIARTLAATTSDDNKRKTVPVASVPHTG